MLSARRILRTVFFAGLLLTLSAFASPAFVSTDGIYTMTYTGSDYRANAIHDSAYFWENLREGSRDQLNTSRMNGQVTLAESNYFVTAPEDRAFSVIKNSRIHQYRINHTYDHEWLDYRGEAMATGGLLMVLVVIVGNLRHYR